MSSEHDRGGRADVFLVGSRITAEPPEDEWPFLSALADVGVEVEWVQWEAGPLPPGCLAMPRAAWTSHRRADEFLRWVSGAVRSGCRFLNPAPLIEWNFDKGYLSELAGRGVPVVPTLRFEPNEASSLAGLFERLRPKEGLVLKPAVSASGEDTWMAREPTPEDEERWRSLSRTRAVLAQPFVPEVVSGGEWSVVLIGGDVSHVVIKRAAAGEFRVQQERGGRVDLVPRSQVPVPVERGALAAHERLPASPHYARMDGVLVDGAFVLMEAELIDPELYFRLQPSAAPRLAARVAALL